MIIGVICIDQRLFCFSMPHLQASKNHFLSVRESETRTEERPAFDGRYYLSRLQGPDALLLWTLAI